MAERKSDLAFAAFFGGGKSGGGGGSVTAADLDDAFKDALLDCFANVAWATEDGQQYYDALEAALYPPADLMSISAVFEQGETVIYDTDELDALKPMLTVTANYDNGTSRTVTDYTLSGTLTAGTSTITVSYGGKTVTFDVTVSAWDFEWFATSGVLPQGMTATSTTWATNNEYADIQNPVYDIGYADMEVEVECAWKTTPQTGLAANTQIIASSAERFGAKIFKEASTGKVCFYGYENGSAAVVYPNVQGSDFHVYRLLLLNGVCKLYVDNTLIAQRYAYSSQYTGAPIIFTADTSSRNKLAIKSIKWRKLS